MASAEVSVTPFPAQAHAYVIGAPDGPQKIGVASTPTKRLSMIQNGNPANLVIFAAIPMSRSEAFAVEKQAHWLLRDDRLRGEWFDVSPEQASSALSQAHADVLAGRHLRDDGPKGKTVGRLRSNSEWRDRLAASGFNQKRFARLIGKTENTVSRQLSGDWEMPQYIKSIIIMLEIMTEDMRAEWIAAVEAELKRRERKPKPGPGE